MLEGSLPLELPTIARSEPLSKFREGRPLGRYWSGEPVSLLGLGKARSCLSLNSGAVDGHGGGSGSGPSCWSHDPCAT